MKKNSLNGHDREGTKKSEYIPGRLVVRWKDDVLGKMPKAAGTRSIRSIHGTVPTHISDPLKVLRERFGLKQIIDVNQAMPASPQRGIRRSMAKNTAAIASSLDPSTSALRGVTVLELNANQEKELKEAAKLLKNDPAVLYAEPAARRWLATSRAKSTDPKLNLQWSLPAINWPGRARPSATSINVAVLDSGVDASHPDLKSAIKSYDHTGVSSEDLIGHGTHVAGIIAAGTNNKIGIAGIANCRLHCWKVFSDEDDGDSVDNVIYYRALGAVLNSSDENEIKIVNLSLGGTALDRTERLLINRLHDKGVLVIAAMGNEFFEQNPTEYPAALRNVIAVGAIKQNMNRAPFSNTGRHIDVVAPGVAILSTLPKRKSRVRAEVMYDSWDGTSMATPIVSAAAALVWAKHRNLTAAEVRQRLIDYKFTTHLPAMNGQKRTNEFGSGLINLKLALA